MTTYSRMLYVSLLSTLLYSHSLSLYSRPAEQPYFNVIPLGTSGGEFQNNLSAYLVAPLTSTNWVALDAGTLCSEIDAIPFHELNKLKIKSKQAFFTEKIKAYLVSHAHLDHINGLVICSTIDGKKEILGLSTTLDYLRDYIFNWKIWPNFGDEGQKPQLNKYHYHRLTVGINTPIPQTEMNVTAYPLSHGNGYPSTAFLLKANDHYLLYFGDTGPDKVEQSHDIKQIWRQVAPLIRKHMLRAIFIECSFPNGRPDNLLFGHLTPQWLLAELHELAETIDPAHPNTALRGLNIVVTHIKQGLDEKRNGQQILQELDDKNDLGVKFIVPVQGQYLSL